jgi:hypothetical protein
MDSVMFAELGREGSSMSFVSTNLPTKQFGVVKVLNMQMRRTRPVLKLLSIRSKLRLGLEPSRWVRLQRRASNLCSPYLSKRKSELILERIMHLETMVL